jgi:hypothetical protein
VDRFIRLFELAFDFLLAGAQSRGKISRVAHKWLNKRLEQQQVAHIAHRTTLPSRLHFPGVTGKYLQFQERRRTREAHIDSEEQEEEQEEDCIAPIYPHLNIS